MLVGVVGPIASGKSVLSEMLEKKGFVKFSLSYEVREIARKRGIPIERKVLQDLGNEMRLKYGADYWAQRVIMKTKKEKNCVIEGLRNLGEISALRKLEDFVLIAVDAPQEKRLQWIMIRGKDSDPSTLEEIKKIDSRDLGEGEPEHGQQSKNVIAQADYRILNSGSKEKLEKVLHRMLKKLELY